MGPNEQNQHFTELRQKVWLYIHVVVLQSNLLGLDGKLQRLVTKKIGKSGCQTRVRQTIVLLRTYNAHTGRACEAEWRSGSALRGP